jgi:hypothetical protein
MTRRVVGALALLLCTVGGVAVAHELAEPSITLSVREGGFVGVRVQLPWSAVLRRRLFPNMNVAQALGTLASLPPAGFATTLQDAQRDIERTLLVRADGAPPRVLTRYVWPSAGEVQQALRTEIMERMATPDGSGHAVRFPVNAELQLSRTARTVQVQPPAAFGATMVTLQRPVERMVRGGAMSSPMVIPVPPG